ncbi:hypothetical protein QYF36_022323 [Acer negundo]|nr:hypothetical protein QYF36_022323 [Acer negundo]
MASRLKGWTWKEPSPPISADRAEPNEGVPPKSPVPQGDLVKEVKAPVDMGVSRIRDVLIDPGATGIGEIEIDPAGGTSQEESVVAEREKATNPPT